MGHKKEAARPVYGLCCCRAGRAVSAAVWPLCAVGLSGSCQAVTLGPDSDRAPLMSDSAVRLSQSDTCCQAVREVLSTLSGCRALSGAVRGCRRVCQAVRPGLSIAQYRAISRTLARGGRQRPKIHQCGISRNRLTLKSSLCTFLSAVMID